MSNQISLSEKAPSYNSVQACTLGTTWCVSHSQIYVCVCVCTYVCLCVCVCVCSFYIYIYIYTYMGSFYRSAQSYAEMVTKQQQSSIFHHVYTTTLEHVYNYSYCILEVFTDFMYTTGTNLPVNSYHNPKACRSRLEMPKLATSRTQVTVQDAGSHLVSTGTCGISCSVSADRNQAQL